MKLTDDELVRLDSLVEKATYGPWVRQIGTNYREVWTFGGNIVCQNCGADDGNFIAASRLALPSLIVEVKRLRLQLEAVNNELQRVQHEWMPPEVK